MNVKVRCLKVHLIFIFKHNLKWSTSQFQFQFQTVGLYHICSVNTLFTHESIFEFDVIYYCFSLTSVMSFLFNIT